MAEYTSKDELYAALDKTVANLAASEPFKQRIARADLSVGFVVTDLDAQYSLYLKQGEVTGSPGGTDETSIAVTMNSATLDRLLSGRLDGESAYMTGQLRLRGSEWVAESAAGYLGQIAAAYRAATES